MPNTDYIEKSDSSTLESKIKSILLRYFECHDDGDPNLLHDEYYTAENAVDDIHDLIGSI